jgi:hypothetical protein
MNIFLTTASASPNKGIALELHFQSAVRLDAVLIGLNGNLEAAAPCVITTTGKTQDSMSLAPAERLIRAINSKLFLL